MWVVYPCLSCGGWGGFESFESPDTSVGMPTKVSAFKVGEVGKDCAKQTLQLDFRQLQNKCNYFVFFKISFLKATAMYPLQTTN